MSKDASRKEIRRLLRTEIYPARNMTLYPGIACLWGLSDPSRAESTPGFTEYRRSVTTSGSHVMELTQSPRHVGALLACWVGTATLSTARYIISLPCYYSGFQSLMRTPGSL